MFTTAMSISLVFCAFIVAVFCFFVILAGKIRKASKALKKIAVNQSDLSVHSGNQIESIVKQYLKSVSIDTPEGRRTSSLSEEYINEISVCRAFGINLRILDFASGALVGLGLLGTFLGLTIGILGFDSSSTDHIQQSIQSLLDGMGTAFTTSLVGMVLSLVYSSLDKVLRYRLSNNVHSLNSELDKRFYIDDATLSDLCQKQLISDFCSKVYNYFNQSTAAIVSEFNGKLTYQGEDGHIVPLSNAMREVLIENQQQTKALKAFSTDLAMELNNGFDETLSRQMQQKILPLMENIDTTTRSVIEHIDQMADSMTAPASDIIEKVVNDLQLCLQQLVSEFNSSVSGSVSRELESLAEQLNTAARTMGETPDIMHQIITSLDTTITEVKQAVSDISSTSANANSTAMQQMQEQITFATGAMSNAIQEVRNVMSSLSQTSQNQNNQMVETMAAATEQMSSFLNGALNSMTVSVGTSVNSITDMVSKHQAELMAIQKETTDLTKQQIQEQTSLATKSINDAVDSLKSVVDSFIIGIDYMEKINGTISGTMDKIQEAQAHITGTAAHLQTISGDMQTATSLFNKSQSEYGMQLKEMQINCQRSIDAIVVLVKESGSLSNEYVNKFELIKQGLGSIFAQIQNGLSGYSRTVALSTQDYLDKYTTSLKNTTDALASTIELQNEVVETLTETLNSRKN